MASMTLRHRLLIAMADGQPHEVRELYSVTADFIKLEEAARVHKDSTAAFSSVEGRLIVAKQRLIVNELSSLCNERCRLGLQYANSLAGTGLYRTYQLTERGLNLAKQRMRDYGLLNDGQQTTKIMYDPELGGVRKEVRQALLELLDESWQELSVLSEIVYDLIPANLAMVAYDRRSDGKRKKPDAYRLKFGKNSIIGDVLKSLQAAGVVERKPDESTKLRKRKPAEEPTPTQVSPVILPFETPAGPDRPPTNLAGNH